MNRLKQNWFRIGLLASCISVAIAVLFVFIPMVASAHPGRTDSSGCHTCRTNCSSWGLSSGEYHCHNAKALPQPKEPIRSHYGEGGTGTTELWPEYKNSPASTLKSNSVPKPVTGGLKSASSITYDLAKGMENGQVMRLQQLLARDPSIYPEAQVTGYYGPATERAVKAFQRKNGLEPVGYTGPKTRALLNALK